MTQLEPVIGRPRETALSIVVPEAEAPTVDFRKRFLDRTIARRIPVHVTLLYPFRDADSIDAKLVETLSLLYASAAPFTFNLARVATFDAHVWLAPEPRERFVELIELTCARFPDCPPYGGAFVGSEHVPHLTIGESEDIDTLRTKAERALDSVLPLACTAGAVTLLEEQTDATWSERATFPLGLR